MPTWLQSLIAFGLLGLAAPFAARLGRRVARNARGGVAIAALLLGVGVVADPPSKHVIEATTPDETDKPAPGDPPVTA